MHCFFFSWFRSWLCQLWYIMKCHQTKQHQNRSSSIIFVVSSRCSPRKYPYLPTEEILSKIPPRPHPFGISNKASYISLNSLFLENPHLLGKFQSLLLGGYGYFLELHNRQFLLSKHAGFRILLYFFYMKQSDKHTHYFWIFLLALTIQS